MAGRTVELYDRTKIVEVIERDFLGIPGSSGVVVGAQKVGKTYLLSHLWDLGNNRKDTIFCRIDVDSLQAAGFSDDSFLRLFLTELQNTIVTNVEQLEGNEKKWNNDLEKLQSRSGGTFPDHTKMVEASLRELSWLRKVEGLIQELLERTEPLEPAQTFEVFNGLRRVEKRVVVLIDEFHRMMREKGFTNRLFAFLRGQSTQGRILTLVSSPVHLMDPSLHGPEAEALYDRLNLFNHYQMQFLEPFSPVEAEGYLEWLVPSVDPPLTADEKIYLYTLCGGSPHFLKKARTLFVDQGRPHTPAGQEHFEFQVSPHFEGDFRLLLERCSPEERAVLTEVASTGRAEDSARVMKLEREGYLIRQAGGVQLFSLLFAQFAKNLPKPESKRAPDRVVEKAPSPDTVILGPVHLVSETFVSALGLARPEDAQIFEFDVTNSGKTNVAIRVACTVVDYSQATIRVYDVEPGKTKTLYGYSLFRPKALSELENPVNTNVKYRISMRTQGGERFFSDQEQLGIRLLPPGNFLMAVFDPASNELKNYTWLIAAWIRRRGNNLQEILNSAGKECELRGYDAPEGEEVPAYTRQQVCALYNAVKKKGIQFQGSAKINLNDETQYMQLVRFPEESLSQLSANCLDMAVLFASLLSSCQISPLVLFVPGHAIVGWKDGSGGCEFMQTTGLSTMNFDEARAIGMDYFRPRKTECEDWLRRWAQSIDDPKQLVVGDPTEFSILVDVEEVARKLHLTPV